ncbi:MAG: hypothetical protein HHJ14_08945 [Cellulomonas sp.]|nr:hypothetical protein [Cellulomonas sp.]
MEVSVPDKYEPLTVLLRAAAERGQNTVDLDFDELSAMVGGLPSSADRRQWWANSSHVQALAWRAAGFHVERVSLDRRRVRFARGERGGSYHDPGLAPSHAGARQPSSAIERVPVGEPIDVRLSLQWHDAGTVNLDDAGKPMFAALESTPGLYRMTFTNGTEVQRARVYVGESHNLRRRLAGNYRNPGPSQQTSLRINALLRKHLGAGGSVAVGVITEVVTWLDGVEHTLDLSRKAPRLLAENAALVAAQMTDDADIENLD